MMRLLWTLIPFLALVFAEPTSTDPGYNCHPGQPCWPSSQQWQALNQSISGHLHQTLPLSAPCYQNSPSYNVAICDIVKSTYNNSIPRGDYYAQTYWLNWETCGNKGCALLSSNPASAPLYPACDIGRLAAYYVEALNTSDIAHTLQFVKKHNIRISIKNTGHDFFGRSSVPNSLAIWTHKLNSMDVYESFTASNCPSANGQNVGEMGAGVVAGDAYTFFDARGMDITGGYEESVGLAGGFGQGGGVGAYTTTYGLMVDNAVEFEVVTADGETRVINECNDPDLFWAMRGGGGGAFAVLTKYRVQLHPLIKFHTYMFSARWNGTVNETETLREILTAHTKNQVGWSKALVTGQVDYTLSSVAFGLVLPYADEGSRLKDATASFAQHIATISNISVLENSYTTYDTYANYLSVSAADAEKTEPPGIFSVLSSRIIPQSLFEKVESMDALVDAIIYGMQTAKSLLPLTATQIVLETPLSNPDTNNATSVQPAWRDAMWQIIHVGEWFEPLSPEAGEKATTGFLDLVQPLKALSPGGGAYVNEAHWGEPDWEDTFFGLNYARLLEVKGRYDPSHLFDCWKCVGWRGVQDSFYSCYKE